MQLLERKIASADSIWLVSHKQTDGIAILDTITNKKSFLKKVVHNGMPNLDVITQSTTLPDALRKKLVSIFQISIKDKTIKTCQFIPFHSILIFKDGKTDFLEISFACNSFLNFSGQVSELEYMGIKQKKALEEFFKRQGLIVD